MTRSVPPQGTVDVPLRLLDDEVPAPAYARPGDAGADLVTRVAVTLAPGARQTVPTGVAVALPEGYAGFVHPRSGLAARHGLTVLNAPGTVDAGYRGEILVTLLNTDTSRPITLLPGDRIAQ
ncbi:MAG TPA: dUTP diphosphatase, partial [Actinomycetales bacterium]